jgi:hypothetical protein
VRVATYNLYLGADVSLLFGVDDAVQLAEQVDVVRRQLETTRFPERAAAVASLLARERPQLVGLQEVSRWSMTPIGPDGSLGEKQVVVDFLPALLGALEEVGCPFDAHVVNENFAGAMPVSDREWMSLVGANVTLVRRDAGVEVLTGETGEFAASLEVVTGIDGVSFPIVRSWGSVDTRVDGVPLRFANTHTEAYDARVRDTQRDELLAHCEAAGSPVVLVGDFNAGPDAVGVPPPWTDAWSASDGPGPTVGQAADLTNRDSTLRERIDYVFVRDVRVLACRRIGHLRADRTVPHRLWPSDHAGVVADLEIAPGLSPEDVAAAPS